jgi:NACHT domain
MAKNRYPGTQPFTAEQSELFYGRKQETEDLMKLIRFQQMVVLYGKSGLGKSSLLNTKIKRQVETQKIAEVFAVRFNAWTDGEETPLSKTVEALLSFGKEQATPKANPIEPIADNTLWYAAKARQLATQKQRYLLVFDQFEELFTYPEAAIQAFKESLAELMRAGLPKRIEERIPTLALSDDDLDTLYETADIKVLFAIRSDRMHLLDKLSDVLPDILRHCYALNALIEADAKEAIVEPAKLVGDFDAPTFQYTEGALSDILAFLKDEDGRIEAIQLQTLCQAFERRITTEGSSITEADTPTDKLKDIIDHYYKTQLDDPRLEDKNTAQRLIEDELVIETGDNKGVRVTLHELSIFVKFANRAAPEAAEKVRLKNLLDALVNIHLLRREVGSRGGDTYELAHDRLIEPVLKSRKVYLAAVEALKLKEQNERREAELVEAKRQADIEKKRAEEAERLTNEANEAKVMAEGALNKSLVLQKRIEEALDNSLVLQRKVEYENKRAIKGSKLSTGFALLALIALAFTYILYSKANDEKEKAKFAEETARESLKKMKEAVDSRNKIEAYKFIQKAEIDIKAKQYYFAKINLDSAKRLDSSIYQIDSLLKQIPR